MNTLTENELTLAKRKYKEHCGSLHNRVDRLGNQIEMRLSFEDWLNIWISSGHYHERGNKRGNFCMSRFNDTGHYEIGNVEIKTIKENTQENTNSAKYREKMKSLWDSPEFRDNHKAAMEKVYASTEWKENNSKKFNSPEFQANHKAAMEKVFESQEWQDRNLAATRLANSKPISCNGQVYASLKEASELAPSNVKDKRYWLNTQMKIKPELYYYV